MEKIKELELEEGERRGIKHISNRKKDLERSTVFSVAETAPLIIEQASGPENHSPKRPVSSTDNRIRRDQP